MQTRQPQKSVKRLGRHPVQTNFQANAVCTSQGKLQQEEREKCGLTTGKFNFDSFADSVLGKISELAAEAAVSGLFGGGSGSGGLVGSVLGGLGGALGNFFGGFSFDGGGFTGFGPRTGGLDGRGGFPAVLHPRETVVDHASGKEAAPVINVSVTVNGDPSPAVVDSIIEASKKVSLATLADYRTRGGQRAAVSFG